MCIVPGKTALHVAVESHDPTGRGIKSLVTTRLLLENGADLNIKEHKRGDTALHMAASLSCDPTLVKVIHPRRDFPPQNLRERYHVSRAIAF